MVKFNHPLAYDSLDGKREKKKELPDTFGGTNSNIYVVYSVVKNSRSRPLAIVITVCAVVTGRTKPHRRCF